MKALFCIVFSVIILILSALPVSAQQTYEEEKLEEISRLELSEEAEKFIGENNISVSETEGIMNLSPSTVLGYVWDCFKAELIKPLKMLAAILTVILISSLLEGLEAGTIRDGMSKTYRIISVLAAVAIVINYISDCIYDAVETLEVGGNFMLCYVPTFSGIVAAGGGVSSATSYHLIIMGAAELFVQISSNYLLPLMSICLCLGIVESINPTISLSGMTDGINKTVKLAVSFISTVFAGLLTLQSIVGTSADTLAVRTGKFMVSNLVPVVGGAVSDAYTTLKGSFGVLRGGVGTFGIIALVITVLPPIMSVAATYLCAYIGQVAADVFSVKSISALMKNTCSVLSMTLAILVCFAMMFIVSTTIVMMIGMDIG